METRPPTGKPSWPIALCAGVEKSGKTFQTVRATASELVGGTYWIGVGEDDPDEYGAMEGANFEIVLHDGTYRDILRAVTEAVAAPRLDPKKPNLIVLDSGGRIWALLSDNAQETANERARRKNKNVGDDGADISMDLWNNATQRWNHILDVLRSHDGPVIITARLDEVTVMVNGQPSKEKTWKVQAQKNLVYDVGLIVQLRALGEAYLTGVRSLRFKPKPHELTRLPDDWSFDGLWRQLGMADGVSAISERSHSGIASRGADEERRGLLVSIKAAAERAGVALQDIANQWAETHAGQSISEATDLGGLELLRDDLVAKAQAQEGNAA